MYNLTEGHRVDVKEDPFMDKLLSLRALENSERRASFRISSLIRDTSKMTADTTDL
jgi:hypothetical protein